MLLFTGQTRFVSDIAFLFPEPSSADLEAIALNQISNQLSSQIIFLVSHKDADTALNIAGKLRDELRNIGGIRILGGREIGTSKFAALHKPAIGALATYSDYKTLKTGHGDALLKRSLASLYMPASSINSSLIRQDPLGLYQEYLQELSATFDANRPKKYNNSYYSPVTVRISESLPINDKKKTRLQVIEKLVGSLEDGNKEVKIHYGGAPRYSQKISQISKSEAGKISVLAVSAIVILLIFLFRSFKPVLGAVLTISIGVAVGAAATAIFFENVHLIAVAFGVSLVGVVVDYAIHFYTSRRANETSEQTANRIKAGLLYGIGTSVLGFAALAFSGVNVLQQIAVYSAFGIVSAGISVVYLLPRLTFLSKTEGYSTSIDMLGRAHRSAVAVVPYLALGLVTIVTAILLLLDVFDANDDVRKLRVDTPELTKTETFLAKYSNAASAKILLVKGTSTEQILQREEWLQDYIWTDVQNEKVSGFWGVSKLIPSIKKQSEIWEMSTELLNTVEGAKLQKLIPSRSTNVELIYADEENRSQLPKEIQDLVLEDKSTDQRGHLVILQGVQPSFDLETLLGEKSWISEINPAKKYSANFFDTRVKSTYSLIGVIVFISLLFIWKMGIETGAKIILVPSFATFSTLALSSLFGVEINFFSVMASFLVFALGADYALFQYAAHSDDKERAYQAVSYSAISTILVFGLLSFSMIPVLQTMGSVVVIGVVLAWLLSPIANLAPEGEYK